MRLVIQVFANGSELSTIPGIEFDPAATLGDLTASVVGSVDLPANFPDHKWIIQHEGKTISMSEDTTLSQAGIKDNDLLMATAQSLISNTNRQARPFANQQAGGGQVDGSQIEGLRQHILNHAPTRARVQEQASRDLVREGETLDGVLNDPVKFRERWTAMEDRRRAEAAEREREVLALNDNITSDNQEEILKRIHQERTEREAMEIMEKNPELFASVTMLYINVEINGRPQKAFVDSGAQTTIMSPQKAEECDLTRHIDARWAGIARGVGTARTLGRIHSTQLSVRDPRGFIETMPCGFTIVVGNDVEIILGLDMLKRYQAKIDLEENCLALQNGAKIPFLPESELPKNPFDGSLREEMDKAAAGSSAKPDDKAKPSSSNFSGLGQSLGGGTPSPSNASAMAGNKMPTTQTPLRPSPQNPTSGSAGGISARASNSQAFSQDKIAQLMEHGAQSPEQAQQLLQAAGGNMDMALSILFDM